MANLKEIRTRLVSVKSTRQITSAMKMVSAAKLRKAQDNIIRLRPYSYKLKALVQSVLSSKQEETQMPLCEQREVARVLIVAITSNKGLCGAFNANVVKSIRHMLDERYSEVNAAGNVDVVCFGKKGADLLKSRGINCKALDTDIIDNPTFEQAKSYAKHIISDFETGKYDVVEMVYNRFKNAAVQELMQEQVLPLEIKPIEVDPFPVEDKTVPDFIWEPDKESILKVLLPKTIKNHIFRALLESVASEHGARMTAMHKATDNASDLIRQLQLDYNKARQASITNEILEIVGGAEAIKS